MISNEDTPQTPEGEDHEYDLWLREKIRKSRIDPRPSVSHEEVMAAVSAKIQAAYERGHQ